MYTRECAERRIKAMGAIGFINWISNCNFSKDVLMQLEQAHIFENGHPCKAEIKRIAAQ